MSIDSKPHNILFYCASVFQISHGRRSEDAMESGMGSKDIAIYERRARARTNSRDTMASEDEPFLPVDQVNKDSIPMPVVYRSSVRPGKLSLMQILLLNAVVCGVEICACAGFTFIPPMLLKAGYTEENMSIILGLGPLLGFFLVPVIGRMSDQCRSSLGRRRPFILVLSVMLIISLIVIPYVNVILDTLLGPRAFTKSLSVLIMTIGVVLLDFTSQACLTPCEALLSDASKETDQYERVFIVYSLMVSLGGFMGYLITAMDWNSTAVGDMFRSQEKTVFSLLTIIFTFLLSATMMVAHEMPISSSENIPIPPHSSRTKDSLLTIGNGNIESGYDTSASETSNGVLPQSRIDIPKQNPLTRTSSKPLPRFNLRMLMSCRLFSVTGKVFHYIWINMHEKLPEPMQRLFEVPYVLRHLGLAHFCSWTAIMGFNLFFTDYVGNTVFKGNPNAPEGSYLRNRFDEGVRMGSWGLLLHCITSASYALFVERLVNAYGTKLTYTFGMVTFSMAMFGMILVENIVIVNAMAALTGFGYATVTTIPFILVSKYHNEKDVSIKIVLHVI